MSDEHKPDPAARRLGRLRWAGKTEAQKRAHAMMMVRARLAKRQKSDALGIQESTKETAK